MFIILIFPALAYSLTWTEHTLSGITGARSIHYGDIDGDGDIDLAAGGTTILALYKNNNIGGFINSTVATEAQPIRDIFISDLDDDGDNDIIYTVAVSDVVRWAENTDGEGISFTIHTISSALGDPTGVYVFDLDNDNDKDVIVTYITTAALNRVSIFKNDGSETFTEEFIFANDGTNKGFRMIDIGDIDDDGDFDIVVGSNTVGELNLYTNDGGVSFTENTISITQDFNVPFIVDLDDDGDKDIVALSQTALSWHNNDGSETFTETNISTFVAATDGLGVADFDVDGDIDIIVANFSTDILYFFENDGTESFTKTAIDTGLVQIWDLIATDLNDDGSVDIATAALSAGVVSWFENSEDITAISCNFPSLFCDDFDYLTPLSEKNWLIQLGGDQINGSFTPIDNKLALTNIQNIFPYHETEPFDVTYRPDSGSRFTRHFLSPVFSSEFILNFTNETSNQFFYTAFEKQFITAYSIKAEVDLTGNDSGNMNWYYLNETQPSSVWKLICANCTTTEQKISIKINSFFEQRDDFPFNSSVDDDKIKFYADNTLLGTIEDYLDVRTAYLSQYEFGKLSDGNYTVDDYIVMVGTDSEVSTFDQYFTDIFTNETTEVVEIGTGETGDMAAALATIWDDMGLKSIASRVMTGLFLMFLLAMIMFGMALKMGAPLSARVLIVVELFFMILLVFIKLLPIWLPFVVVLVAAGIGAGVTKFGTQT